MKTAHKVNVKRAAEADNPKDNGTAAKTLKGYFPPESRLDRVISRMAALDGIPLATFTTSTDLRGLLSRDGHKDISKSKTAIKNTIIKFAETIRTQINRDIKGVLNRGVKLAATMDEWTSTRNRRYMNVNLHTAEEAVFNLGVERVFGSADAAKCQSIIEKLLSPFGVTINNILSTTTDGAPVMIKMGRSLGHSHVVCMAHGIHLAVCQVLYKNAERYFFESLDEDESADSEVENLKSPFEITNNLPNEFELTMTNNVGE